MNKYDVYSQDNRAEQKYYVKIGTYPLQPNEKNNYNFPPNNNNIIIDVYWFGAYGNGQYAKFGVALKNSTSLNIGLLSINQEGKIVENPIAYVRTEDGFDIYLRANSDIYGYLNVKCNIIESKENRFIPLSGNEIIDISNLNPTYYNVTTLKIDDNTTLTNVNLTNVYNNHVYNEGTNTISINIPNYQSNKRYLIHIYNGNTTTFSGLDVLIVSGNCLTKNLYDNTNLSATFNEGVITLTGSEYYSIIYYEIIEY